MMKLCVNQSNEEQQRYSVSSPAMFEYEEGTYSYSSDGGSTLRNLTTNQQQSCLIQNTNSNSSTISQATGGLTSQIPNYTQSHSPASIESTTFTPSPSRSFDYPTSPSTKPSIPANTDYPGEYDFQIDFGELTDYAPKSAQYTYSKSLNKLFVKMNVTCPIRFKCASRLPPSGCSIRAIPVFKRPEHVTDIVTRCPNHKIPDEVHYIPNGHLIRAESTNECHVNYHVGTDGRESVTVLYERPQVGAEYSTVLYKFMCLSSCVGGINRRPLLTCFTLERDGQVLGRRVVEVRICSCPGRDRSQEERRRNTNKNELGSTSTSRHNFRYINGKIQNVLDHPASGKKRRYLQTTSATNNSNNSNNSDNGDFILHIRGREKFEYLRKMKEALDLMEMISPNEIESYRNRDEEDHANLFRSFKISATQPSDLRDELSRSSQMDTSSSSSIKTSYTISEPLPINSTPNSQHQLHYHQSSPPLTATPTGISPNPTSTSSNGADLAAGSVGTVNTANYWGFVDPLSLGCDVPDVAAGNGKSEATSWLESLHETSINVPSTNSRLNLKSLETNSNQLGGGESGVATYVQTSSNSNRSSPFSNTGHYESNNSRVRLQTSQNQEKLSSDELFNVSFATRGTASSTSKQNVVSASVKREVIGENFEMTGSDMI